jgi:hypothetical protein
MACANQLVIEENDDDLSGSSSLSDSRRVVLGCCAVAVLFGAVDALSSRHSMVPDGISYLDISDAIRHGNWGGAVNAYWAPLYPVVLAIVLGVVKPSPYWEFSIAHLANFLIYIGALASFSYFLRVFIDYVESVAQVAKAPFPLPRWLWVIVGYTSFTWCSLQLIQMEHVNPDMLLSIFLYLAAAILLRIRMGNITWQTYLLLGLVIGVGYLAKGPMFPLGIAFLVTSVFAAGNLARGLRLGLVAAVLFFAISLPFVYRISKATGHFTFGDNAVINYTSNINLVPEYYWQQSSTSLSSRTYPAKQLFAYPAVYEFTMPLRGTYVYWFNPAEWYRGVKPRLVIKDNTRQLLYNLRTHYVLFFHMIPVVTGTIAVLLIFNRLRGRAAVKDIYRVWILLAVPVFGLTMYTLVFFEYRHVASLILPLLLGLFAGVCVPDSREAQQATTAIVLGMVVMLAFQLFMSAIAASGSLHLAEFSRKGDKAANVQWEIADDLHRTGLNEGDKIAWLRPDHFDALNNYWWARMSKVQIVAEIPDNKAFWAVDEDTRAKAIQSLSHTGVKGLVLSDVPRGVSLQGFVQLGSTGYYVHLFPE